MNMPDEKFVELLDRVTKYKMDILFEEPCPLYEDENFYWHDYISQNPETKL